MRVLSTFGDKNFRFRSSLVKTLELDSPHLNILQASSSRLTQTLHCNLCTGGVSNEAQARPLCHPCL